MAGTADLIQSAPNVGLVDSDVACIDMREIETGNSSLRAQLVDDIHRSCRSAGFFYLTNWTDKNATAARTLEQMQAFFSLADDAPLKTKLKRDVDDYGYTPPGGEPAYQPGTVSHLESFDFGLTATATATSGDIWPRLPEFRETATECWNEFAAAGHATLSLISEAAGLDRSFLPRHCQTQELNTMRLLHYPANNNGACDRNVGIAAHTDFECMTFIYQSAPGLELAGSSRDWRDAPTHDGRIVVLLGDMLERWTNGYFTATGHRVRNTPEQRFSIVMFFAADDAMDIEPQPQFVTSANPARYAAISQARHIDAEITRAKQQANVPEPPTAA